MMQSPLRMGPSPALVEESPSMGAGSAGTGIAGGHRRSQKQESRMGPAGVCEWWSPRVCEWWSPRVCEWWSLRVCEWWSPRVCGSYQVLEAAPPVRIAVEPSITQPVVAQPVRLDIVADVFKLIGMQYHQKGSTVARNQKPYNQWQCAAAIGIYKEKMEREQK